MYCPVFKMQNVVKFCIAFFFIVYTTVHIIKCKLYIYTYRVTFIKHNKLSEGLSYLNRTPVTIKPWINELPA